MIWRRVSAMLAFTVCIIFATGCQSTSVQQPSVDAVVPVVNPGNSVIRVTVTNQGYSFYRPWMKQRPGTRQGLGALLSKNRVLVTATLVEDAAFVELEKLDTGDQAPARVVCIDYMANLAILECDRPEFLDGMKPLTLKPKVAVGEQVEAWQFEDNGTPFITEGVVRTIETGPYPIENRSMLVYRVEISLSRLTSSYVIPMVQDGELIGLLMNYNAGTRIMSLVSGPVIEHFLADLEDGEYEGFPQVGISFAFLDDPQFRDYLNVSGVGGVYVTNMHPIGAAAQAGLQKGDVIIRIGKHIIDRNGQYDDPEYGRLSLSHLVSTRSYVGDTLSFYVIRDGESITIDVPVDVPSAEAAPIPDYIKSRPPNYVVQGGLVFLELSTDYLRQWGDQWEIKSPQRLRYYLDHQWEFLKAGQRLVFLSHVLPSHGTIGYQDLSNDPVSLINGQEIHSLLDAEKAFAAPVDGFHIVEFRNQNRKVYLKASTVAAENVRIQQLYQIQPLSRVADLP